MRRLAALGLLVLFSCTPAEKPEADHRSDPQTDPTAGPAAGNPDGSATVPSEALAADVSSPDHVLGTGTPESVTEVAFRAAVAEGGVITFNAGTVPFTLTLTQPAKVYNNKPDVVIDGGGIVTLSGGGNTRILYLSTRDPDLVWTTDHAQNQEHPQLTVQNLTFVDGWAGEADGSDVSGGGAIWAYGGRLKIVGCRFFNNGCVSSGPDVGGGAVRAFAQYNSLPISVVDSTFGGPEGYGNYGSNGGAISSIGVNWSIYNSLFQGNRAVGYKGNPAEGGTKGGGSGGAIYNDGLTLNLSLYGTKVEGNTARAYGSAIFFVFNNHEGVLRLEDSVVRNNTGGGWDDGHPGISLHSDDELVSVGSTVE